MATYTLITTKDTNHYGRAVQYSPRCPIYYLLINDKQVGLIKDKAFGITLDEQAKYAQSLIVDAYVWDHIEELA